MGTTMEKKKYNWACVTGFVFGILSTILYWLVPFFPVFAIIFSGIGLSKVKKEGVNGRGLAIAGLVLGIMFCIQIVLKLSMGMGL
jgi:hypothetical protein